MARFFKRSEIDESLLKEKTIAILGYGNQGRAQALNLRDSGHEVVIGARTGGEGAKQAIKDGFMALRLSEAASAADVAMLSLPDTEMGEIAGAHIDPFLKRGALVLLSHGFAIRFGVYEPRADVSVGLVAPKGAGWKLRANFEAGSGLAGMVAIHRDVTGNSLALVLAYASAIGCARVGIMETTFDEETVTDLFGEQAVLCGGLPEMLKSAFGTLVAAGYQPEVAYIECLHEAKLILDLIYAKGMAGMRDSISETALYGGLTEGPNVVTDATREAMAAMLKRIQSGEFAENWIAEAKAGKSRMKKMVQTERSHGVNTALDNLLKAMPGFNKL
ncbi:MAG: ketol-acid reductoisomerase [Armatimonadetes bacterium]|nr:ketol-acid reductoisomerase [Armatimonadota bacterium]